jgi:hypothetical protein
MAGNSEFSIPASDSLNHSRLGKTPTIPSLGRDPSDLGESFIEVIGFVCVRRTVNAQHCRGTLEPLRPVSNDDV